MIEFLIKVNKIISENTYLAPGIRYTKTRKPYPYLYKKPDVCRYQEEIISYLRDINARELVLKHIDIFGYNKYFKTSWVFYRLEKLNISDLTNMKKLVEDAICTFIREDCDIKTFDDSLIISDTSIKKYIPDSPNIAELNKNNSHDFEYINFKLEPYIEE